jgi:enterochelin esterase family protein
VSTLDNLIADRAVPALTTVAVESVRGGTRHEGLTHPDLFEPFLVDELVPWLRARSDVGRVVLAGQSLGGLTVAWTALRHPGLFGRVVTSSMAAWWPGDGRGGLSGAQVVQAYGRADPEPIRFFMEVGSRERELLASVRAYRDVLAGQGYDVRYREYEGGHDIACWLGGLADGLIALLEN